MVTGEWCGVAATLHHSDNITSSQNSNNLNTLHHYLGRLGDAGQLENVESEESLWVWNYQQSHRCIVFQDNNTTELLPSVSLSQSHVRSVLINERRQGGQLWTNQLTVKSSRGRGLGSLEPEKLSLLGFFCLAGTFGVSTFVSQGPRDLLTSDQAANIYK